MIQNLTKKYSYIAVILITIFSFWLRINRLNTAPPSLNWDEVSHGYNAYSILKTTRDEWGIKLPLIFRAFGDYKLPLYIYLTTIPVFFMGLGTMSVRLVSVLAGSIAVPGIYLLSRQLFYSLQIEKILPQRYKTGHKTNHNLSEILAILSAFLISIFPWHFFISRPALEANLALTLIIFGIWSLLKALKNDKFFCLASILLGLSLYAYNSARVFVPLLIISWWIIYRPKFKLNTLNLFSFLFMATSFLVVFYQVLSGTGIARYNKLAILSDTNIYQIGQDRIASNLPKIGAKLIHNRPVYFITQFSRNYLSFFSLGFVYQTKGVQTQFAIPGKNMFTLPILILFILGLVYLIKVKKTKTIYFILLLLLLSLVPAALTDSPPQSLRPTPAIPAVIIISSLGFLYINSFFKRKKLQIYFSTILVLTCVLAFGLYLHSYYSNYNSEYSQAWQFGYKDAINYIQANKNKYKNIIFTKKYGEPHIFYAFYSHLPPQEMWPNKDNIRYHQSDWFWTDKINDTYFVNDWDIPKKLLSNIPLESGGSVSTKNSLLILSPKHIPSNIRILKIINFKDGSPAFIIAETLKK